MIIYQHHQYYTHHVYELISEKVLVLPFQIFLCNPVSSRCKGSFKSCGHKSRSSLNPCIYYFCHQNILHNMNIYLYTHYTTATRVNSKLCMWEKGEGIFCFYFIGGMVSGLSDIMCFTMLFAERGGKVFFVFSMDKRHTAIINYFSGYISIFKADHIIEHSYYIKDHIQ